MHRDGSPGNGERELVHRLVLTAFVRPAAPGEQACHRNGDPSDNRLSNLYWGSQERNWRDRLRHGRGRSYAKLTEPQAAEIRRRCEAGESAYSVAKDFPVSDTQIRNIASGRHWVNPDPDPVVTKPARTILDCVWLGVSVENQQWADIRIPALLGTPAAVRWLSCEPLLGPVNLDEIARCDGPDGGWSAIASLGHGKIPRIGVGIDWVVVGGESGPGARPMHPDWARSLRDQCASAGVPFFFKQHGEWAPAVDLDPDLRERAQERLVGQEYVCRVGKKRAGRELDGRSWDQYPEAAR